MCVLEIKSQVVIHFAGGRNVVSFCFFRRHVKRLHILIVHGGDARNMRAYDLPIMENYISLDDATIVQTFADAGYQTYNMLGEGEEGVDVMKIPSDVTLVDAALVYAKGVSNMDAVTASKYLVGSWRFTVSRTNGTEMKVRYCDLAAENAQDAVQHAWQSEGWADNGNVTITAEGVDEIGNTYREGTIETESGTHSWRISVCDLDGVYSISGLPSTAQYVGIRMN